jgi:hypothetical protein
MPYEEWHTYLDDDILKCPLQGKVAARGRFLFSIWDLLDEQAV